MSSQPSVVILCIIMDAAVISEKCLLLKNSGILVVGGKSVLEENVVYSNVGGINVRRTAKPVLKNNVSTDNETGFNSLLMNL